MQVNQQCCLCKYQEYLFWEVELLALNTNNLRRKIFNLNIIILIRIGQMIQYQNLDADECLEHGLNQKISFICNKEQPYKFLQHLNEKIKQKFPLSKFENETLQTINFQQQYNRNQIHTCQVKLKPMINENSNIYKEENEMIQFSKSQPLERLHQRKKNIVQKKLSQINRLDGQGFTKLQDGRVVFGKWKNGAFVGNAKIIYPSQNVYIGEVKRYNRHGRGLLIFKTGERYVGNFVNGKYDGYGTKYDVNFQKLFEGVWRQGVLIKRVI